MVSPIFVHKIVTETKNMRRVILITDASCDYGPLSANAIDQDLSTEATLGGAPAACKATEDVLACRMRLARREAVEWMRPQKVVEIPLV